MGIHTEAGGDPILGLVDAIETVHALVVAAMKALVILVLVTIDIERVLVKEAVHALVPRSRSVRLERRGLIWRLVVMKIVLSLTLLL